MFCFGTKTWKKVVFVLDVFLFVCFECSPTSDLLKCSFFITSPSHHHKASRITQVANVQAEHKHLPLRAWECHRRQRSLEQKSLFSQHVYRFGRIVVRCIEASSTGDSAICVVLSLRTNNAPAIIFRNICRRPRRALRQRRYFDVEWCRDAVEFSYFSILWPSSCYCECHGCFFL